MPRVRNDFLVNLAKLKDEIGRSRNAEAGKDWLRMQKFAESGVGLPYKRAGELARLVISGYSDTYIAEKFGITNETVRYHRKNISDTIYNYLGKDILTLFSSYKANKVEIRHRLAVIEMCFTNPESLFPLEVVQPLMSYSGSVKSFSVSECESELIFLTKYSLRSINSDIQGLDRDKLAYLLKVIGGEDGTNVNDRVSILSRLVEGTEEYNEEVSFDGSL